MGWPLTDPIYQRIIHARNALDALRVFVDDIGQNPAAPPATPGISPYVDDPEVAPGRKRARQT